MAETTVIKQGDTVILRARYGLTQAQAVEIKRRVMERIPGIADVVILCDIDEIAVVRMDDNG